MKNIIDANLEEKLKTSEKTLVQKVLFGIVCVLVFFIPIEHKYDKLFRHFSHKIIPVDLGSGSGSYFDFNIYFYPSDVLMLLVFLGIVFFYRSQVSFLKNGLFLLYILFFLVLMSVFNSPLNDYLTIYTRLWGLLTGSFIYFLFVNLTFSEKDLKILFLILMTAAFIQAVVSCTQYFSQQYLGLRLLGETKDALACFKNDTGNLWILDKIREKPLQYFKVRRASGTFSNCNPLGGFLALGCLSVFPFLFYSSKKYWKVVFSIVFFILFFSLCLSFSRSAFWGFIIATFLWFSRYRSQYRSIYKKNTLLKTVVISFISTLVLLSDQFFARGGIFSSTNYSHKADIARLDAVKTAFSMIGDSPLWGVGFQQFTISAAKLGNPTGVHNVFLFLAAESGIFSSVIFLMFFFYVFRKCWQYCFDPFLDTFLAMLTCLLVIACLDFYPLLFQQGKLMTFIVCGGCVAAANRLTQKRSDFCKQKTKYC